MWDSPSRVLSGSVLPALASKLCDSPASASTLTRLFEADFVFVFGVWLLGLCSLPLLYRAPFTQAWHASAGLRLLAGASTQAVITRSNASAIIKTVWADKRVWPILVPQFPSRFLSRVGMLNLNTGTSGPLLGASGSLLLDAKGSGN